jgi:hypothetical protein
VLKYLHVIRSNSMAQYKHDRFFKFYIQSLYRTKGDTQQNIQVRNDEDLEIDLMFISDRSKNLFEKLKESLPSMSLRL